MEQQEEWCHNVYCSVAYSEASSAQPGHEGVQVIQVHDLNSGELLLEVDANQGIALLNKDAPPGQCPDQLVMAIRWRWCFTYNPYACYYRTIDSGPGFKCGANKQPCNKVTNTYKCG